MQQFILLRFAFFDDKGNLRLRTKVLFFFVAAIISTLGICVHEPPKGGQYVAAVALPLMITLLATLVALPIERFVFARLIPKYKKIGQPLATYAVIIFVAVWIVLLSLFIARDRDIHNHIHISDALIDLFMSEETIVFIHAPMILYICINGFVYQFAPSAEREKYTDILDDL
jgi:lysylphosphatidylglycerol synthetase-like protein (DUF2156 family)